MMVRPWAKAIAAMPLRPAPVPTTAAAPAPMNTNAKVPMNSARSLAERWFCISISSDDIGSSVGRLVMSSALPMRRYGWRSGRSIARADRGHVSTDESDVPLSVGPRALGPVMEALSQTSPRTAIPIGTALGPIGPLAIPQSSARDVRTSGFAPLFHAARPGRARHAGLQARQDLRLERRHWMTLLA